MRIIVFLQRDAWVRGSYLYKTTTKEFEFLYKSDATAVAMATMTFQDGGYFGFKVI
jgi:hypothetical protein